jgi:hypothetical protein
VGGCTDTHWFLGYVHKLLSIPLARFKNHKFCKMDRIEVAEKTEVVTDSRAVDQNAIDEAERNLNDVPQTSKLEIWSYYLYANGANGVGSGNYVPLIFQQLATERGYDPTLPGQQPCTNSNQRVIPFGVVKNFNVAGVILLMNGISFLFQMVFFVWLGSIADYSILLTVDGCSGCGH